MYKSKEELKLAIQTKYSKVGFFRRIFSWKDIIENIQLEIDQLADSQEEINILKGENVKLSTINEQNSSSLEKMELLKKSLEEKTLNLEKEIEIKGNLQEQIDSTNKEMLKYAKELHTVFKSSTGSQGKLSEVKLERTLEGMFGEEGEIWVKNLQIGDGRVEFAIKPDPSSDKWVPVDSKSYVPKIDDNGNFVIDSQYINKVKNAAKDISKKYVGKANTEKYAIMVLPSEGIYSDIFYSGNEKLIKELADINIYMTSPSNFTQFASTVYRLNDRMKIVEESKDIVNEMKTAYSHMVNFANATKEGLEKMNIAYDKHMPNAEKKLESIKETIDSTKKIK